MIRSNFKLLGLCAVMLGVMAFAASAAQAEVGAKWLIEGTDAASLLAAVGGELEEIEKASLLSEVLGIEVEILCEEATLIGIHFEANGSLTKGGKVHFSECSVDLDGVPSGVCVPSSPGAEPELILTNAGKGLLSLVLPGVSGTVIEPLEGTTFVNINMGPECPIGENIPVRGKLVLADTGLTTPSVEHLIRENEAHSDMWVLSKTAEHKATIDGSAWVFLTGEHKGLKWSGDPL
jgi:hypothetical protein